EDRPGADPPPGQERRCLSQARSRLARGATLSALRTEWQRIKHIGRSPGTAVSAPSLLLAAGLVPAALLAQPAGARDQPAGSSRSAEANVAEAIARIREVDPKLHAVIAID